jgi:arylsulfatase A-like enzyme
VVDALVEQLDVPATLREIAGAPPIPQSEGRSLLPRLRGNGAAERVVSVSENWGFAAFETERHKLVVDEDAVRACQLFDLREDPEEDHDLLADPRSRVLADEIMETHVRPFFQTPPARPHPSVFTGGTPSEDRQHQGV